MKITFLGANHEVTGSCTLIEAAGQRFLIDCGMEQGKDVYENQPIPVAPGEIDWVLATHAHIDHTGMLPLLVRNGFRGKIYATNPTVELCGIMLRDSAHIQEFEAEWKNRKGQRSGAEPVEPMYTVQDAEAAMKLFVGKAYEQRFQLAPGIEARFVDVGHLLGSASIELWITEGETTTKLVFSGDIGNLDQPIIKDPAYIKEADYAFMESTYGDRSHGPKPDYVSELTKILQRTFDRGGNVVIPSFAVGRTQEMLYFIREIKEKGLVKGHGNFPVYIDSPLAIEATRIFKDTDPDCFDADTRALLEKGIDPITFPGLRVTVTSDESRMINADRVPKVILSASGMCEAGRIRHHLKHNLWRPECTILFVGYQAVGTLGRTLLEGATTVKLFGEPIEVQAELCQLTGMSGHADREGLLRWVNSFEQKPKRVFVMHGEDETEDHFVQTLTEQGFTACAPYNGAQWAIGAEGAVCLQEGMRVRIEHKANEGQSRAASVFQRLVSAGKRLLPVSEHNEVCRILTEIGQLRKEENPRITGYEYHILNLVSYCCPKYLIVDKLRETLEELRHREPDARPNFRVKIAVVGSEIDDPEFTKMLEMAGGMVVADRYCFGSMPGREEIPLEEGKDVLQSIADYYMWRNQCPRAMGPENIIARKKYIFDLAEKYRADGIIVENMKFCEYWGYERAQDGMWFYEGYELPRSIPVCQIEKDYTSAASGQLRTRFQAFIESLEIKKIQAQQ